MCLALPGKVKSISAGSAEVDFSGIKRKISTALVPKVKKGDYVIVHAGFAIQILDKKNAKETIKLFEELI